MTKADKVKQISACPDCLLGLEPAAGGDWSCPSCGARFPVMGAVPLLVSADSPFRDMMLKRKAYNPADHGWLHRLHRAFRSPEERRWSRRSRAAIDRLLAACPPDDPSRCVMNVGAGIEKIFRRPIAAHQTFLRVGLPHLGHVDIFGDAMHFPIRSDALDLVFSSSVIEHLRDPERAAAELFRVLKPGGRVYAEIPFLRAYHMAPYDYQRYTISGIEALFERQGFVLLEKGVCSGPFTALALGMRDFCVSITPTRRLKHLSFWVSSWLVQPLKWLDGLANHARWAEDCACNFYYVGEKPNAGRSS